MLVVAATAFAFFILCPRMAGMAAVIADIKGVNPYQTVAIGALIAVPLFLVMLAILKRFGVGAAIAFAVATDIGAAAFMGIHSWKSTVEVLVIAAFVWMGVVAARLISSALFP